MQNLFLIYATLDRKHNLEVFPLLVGNLLIKLFLQQILCQILLHVIHFVQRDFWNGIILHNWSIDLTCLQVSCRFGLNSLTGRSPSQRVFLQKVESGVWIKQFFVNLMQMGIQTLIEHLWSSKFLATSLSVDFQKILIATRLFEESFCSDKGIIFVERIDTGTTTLTHPKWLLLQLNGLAQI